MRLQVGQERHRVANCVLFVLRFRRLDEGLKVLMRRAVLKPLVGLGSEIVDDETQPGQRGGVWRSVRSDAEILGAELRDAAFAQRPKEKSPQLSRRLGILGLVQRRGMFRQEGLEVPPIRRVVDRRVPGDDSLNRGLVGGERGVVGRRRAIFVGVPS